MMGYRGEIVFKGLADGGFRPAAQLQESIFEGIEDGNLAFPRGPRDVDP